MSYHFGVLLALLSLILGGHLIESSIDVADLQQSKCRMAGVALVEKKDRSMIFNYTMADSACQALGLQLANKEQMEKARGYGYETCSFGWILDKVGAIPRIQHNTRCGSNRTGVVLWPAELSKTFVSTYCFNVSDVRINSCKPGLMVTEPPSTVVVPTSGSTMAMTSLRTETPTESTAMSTAHVRTTAEASTTSLYTTLMTTTRTTRPTTLQTTRPTTLQTTRPTMHRTTRPTKLQTTRATTHQTTRPTTHQTTPSEDTEPPTKPANQMAQKTERLIFGGLPTTLLILALVFFVAAVALAVCYIKKYKTHLLFTTKKHQKELVETKVFKDTSGAENTSGEERYTNLQGAENPQKCTGNSIEAEV